MRELIKMISEEGPGSAAHLTRVATLRKCETPKQRRANPDCPTDDDLDPRVQVEEPPDEKKRKAEAIDELVANSLRESSGKSWDEWYAKQMDQDSALSAVLASAPGRAAWNTFRAGKWTQEKFLDMVKGLMKKSPSSQSNYTGTDAMKMQAPQASQLSASISYKLLMGYPLTEKEKAQLKTAKETPADPDKPETAKEKAAREKREAAGKRHAAGLKSKKDKARKAKGAEIGSAIRKANRRRRPASAIERRRRGIREGDDPQALVDELLFGEAVGTGVQGLKRRDPFDPDAYDEDPPYEPDDPEYGKQESFTDILNKLA